LRSGKNCWKTDEQGPQTSCDGGKTWSFTFRGREEWLQMFPDAQETEKTPPETDEDRLRETFGETLDDPLPDDFVAYVSSLTP